MMFKFKFVHVESINVENIQVIYLFKEIVFLQLLMSYVTFSNNTCE
jgi:hypothetical protein